MLLHARNLLEEQYGEAKVIALPTLEKRKTMRLHRSLLSGVIAAYDYAPWASHLVRRFCTMEEHRAAAKRKRDEDDRTILSIVSSVRRDTGATRQPSNFALSPSLARDAGPIVNT